MKSKKIKKMIVTVSYTVGTGNIDIPENVLRVLSQRKDNDLPITEDDLLTDDADAFNFILDNTINEVGIETQYKIEELEVEE